MMYFTCKLIGLLQYNQYNGTQYSGLPVLNLHCLQIYSLRDKGGVGGIWEVGMGMGVEVGLGWG